MPDTTDPVSDTQRIRDHATWLRARAAETGNDLYRWLMESVAEKLEQRANDSAANNGV